MQPAAPIVLPRDVAWPVPARPAANSRCLALGDPMARPEASESNCPCGPLEHRGATESNVPRGTLERTNPRHAAADALDAHPSASVRAIGRWLRAGARGSLDRHLEGGARHALAER